MIYTVNTKEKTVRPSKPFREAIEVHISESWIDEDHSNFSNWMLEHVCEDFGFIVDWKNGILRHNEDQYEIRAFQTKFEADNFLKMFT
jgi:hypothetical protein